MNLKCFLRRRLTTLFAIPVNFFCTGFNILNLTDSRIQLIPSVSNRNNAKLRFINKQIVK